MRNAWVVYRNLQNILERVLLSAEQVGLGLVDNTPDMAKPVSTPTLNALSALYDTITAHATAQNNPHQVTAAQIGLGNVNNTADANKPISAATQVALDYLLGLIQAIEGGLMYQGRFTPSNGQDGSGAAIPAPASGNRGWIWIAANSATWTPPGGAATLFNVGDWLISSGTRYDTISATQINVLQVLLTGFTVTNAPIVASDTILQALGKAQGQLNNRAPLEHTHTPGQAGADPAGSAAAVQGNLNSHANQTTDVHGATAAASANTIALRGAGATLAVGAPTADNHAIRRADLNAAIDGLEPPSQGAPGVSTTPAGTAAKEVIIEGVNPSPGDIVWVRFNAQNTTANPTLNVNTAGAMPIRLNGATLNSAMMARRIGSGKTYGFVHAGDAWEMIIPASNLPTLGHGYGTMTAAATTVGKTGTLANFTRHTGSVVWLLVSNTNTALNPTLNVNSSGAAAIRVNGVALDTAERAGQLAAGLRGFVFNGSQWELINPVTARLRDDVFEVFDGTNWIQVVRLPGGAHFGIAHFSADNFGAM